MRIGWAVTAAATTAVLALVLAPPFLGEGIRGVLMAGFSGVCHQIAERSPHLDGVQLAVCDRCLGIYAALAAASMLYPVMGEWGEGLRRHAKYLVVAAVLVPGIDWAGDVAGLWVNTRWSRLLTGAVFGGVAGHLLTDAVVDLLYPGSGERGSAMQRIGVKREAETGSHRA